MPAPVKVEIPGFAKAMPNAKVVERTRLDEVEVDTFDKDKFDLAHLAKEMMERRKRVERWRREQKRKVMVEVHEEVKEEKRRQRKAALEDKNNPWVEVSFKFLVSFIKSPFRHFVIPVFRMTILPRKLKLKMSRLKRATKVKNLTKMKTRIRWMLI